jgi:hypothetical protein
VIIRDPDGSLVRSRRTHALPTQPQPVDTQVFQTGSLHSERIQGCAYVRVISKDLGTAENDYLVPDIVRTYEGCRFLMS